MSRRPKSTPKRINSDINAISNAFPTASLISVPHAYFTSCYTYWDNRLVKTLTNENRAPSQLFSYQRSSTGRLTGLPRKQLALTHGFFNLSASSDKPLRQVHSECTPASTQNCSRSNETVTEIPRASIILSCFNQMFAGRESKSELKNQRKTSDLAVEQLLKGNVLCCSNVPHFCRPRLSLCQISLDCSLISGGDGFQTNSLKNLDISAWVEDISMSFFRNQTLSSRVSKSRNSRVSQGGRFSWDRRFKDIVQL